MFESSIKVNRDTYLAAFEAQVARAKAIKNGEPVPEADEFDFVGMDPGESDTGDEYVAAVMGHLHGMFAAAGLIEVTQSHEEAADV